MPDNFTFQSGAEIDIRTEDQKLKDYTFKEIVSAATPVNWVEKPQAQWRRFPDQDQDGSGSCVMQTIRKLSGILLWLKEKTYVVFSGAYYNLRSNKPESGMYGVEAFDIWKNNGLPLEQLVPSERLNDSQMDAIQVEQYEKDIAKVFKIGAHIGIDNGDFETVASVIQQTGKGVMVWFFFNGAEWSQQIPTVQDHNLTIQSGLRHSVAAVDYFLYQGKKYLLIEDSAHFAGFTYHLISEEFFKARNWFVRYSMNFIFQSQIEPQPEPQPSPINPKPKYNFTSVLLFGQTSAAIKALQDILKYEGLFPTNVASTSYYGAITAKGVYNWQVKHKVAPLSELNALQGRRVGDKTIIALNEIYS